MIPDSKFNSFLGAFSSYKEDLLLRGSAPMVSISGGQDSIFLAWTVFHFQNERQLFPIGLYCNHLWHAEGFFHGVHSLRLAFIFGWPVLYTLPFHPVYDEELAWEFRRRLRQRLCSFYGTDQVLLGHTKTDQMESFLFHLLRGSLHEGSFFPEQRRFSFLSPEPTTVEATPLNLFTLESSNLDWSPVTPLSSAYGIVRTHSLF